ncbi:putative UbiC transcription regulator-associated protein [Vibrio nigripulchritudo MADA3029]|uniref:GntR family transcriptional regulator n=1 Tax=Vibrio nigripulchritudo TaxID=28173 RepID=UPI00021C10F6|nr:GntR family transcriptional regulator [Vibrio nigripulchritudo]EGU60581.1 GntR family transcriptional regulator [Vibrio nigripulchritudo ATCC 27043]CCN36264.1 putative UbiC transcription regulator-associated protein [Vibrio nigripulchritudo AM115]CCN39824.1 putative UbiC transcription regulator-associated protein [Vibrio nigripulchritudo FTn2]CCN48093.1 putative UbiC transcription regulator-associated protein [Vibrio nigripulchritudo MADA3020]CCN54991.1 putative UbiC transcription regulator
MSYVNKQDKSASVGSRGRGRPKNDANNSQAITVLNQIAAGLLPNRKSSVPLWLAVKNALADSIHRQELPVNTRLPSEQTMCEILGVSRSVIRSALGSLSSEGLLNKVARTGIFVAPPKMETDFLTSNMSVHSDLEARGYKVTSQTFEFRKVNADEAESKVFNLPKDGKVVRIERIYSFEDTPITHTIISLPSHKVPGFENIDIEDQSIFQLLKERYGLVSRRAERWLNAVIPSEDICKKLRVENGQPVIAIESIAYDSSDMPLEFYRAYYNSAIARIHVATSNVHL